MCGILGGIFRRPVEPGQLNEALHHLVHRGPDDQGVHVDGRMALAMTRLAVIDPAGGHQPLHDADRRLWLICNGEIYNDPPLRRELQRQGRKFLTDSDAETALHLYAVHGENFVRRLRGMFALALWDAERHLLILARDRFGKKPLYYAQTPSSGLVFASELKALRPLGEQEGLRWSLRDQSVYDYLSLGVVPQPHTIYQQAQVLQPGTMLLHDASGMRVQPFWAPRSNECDPRISYPEALESVRKKISDAVQVRLRADVPLGVFLSGGIDSSIVAYEAARQIGPELRTFTVAMPDRTLDEAPVARRTAARLGVRNEVLPLELDPLQSVQRVVAHYDQPFADSSAIPTMAIARLARQKVTVILTGDGGDELFAGYRRHLSAAMLDRWYGGVLSAVSRPLARMAARRPETAPSRRSTLGLALRFARGAGDQGGARYLSWTNDLMQDADKRALWRRNPGSPRSCSVEPAPGVVLATEDFLEPILEREDSALAAQMATDIRVNLLSDLLVKMDMATMAVGLEARSPLLDHELAELVWRLPPQYLTRGLRSKALLRDAYREFLAEEVLDAPKRGFEIPLQRWLDEDLADLLGDTLRASDARLGDWIDRRALEELLDGGGWAQVNRPALIYALLVLELWLRENS